MGSGSETLTFALCAVVWALMGLLPVGIYRLRRGLLKWIMLLALNAGLWCCWVLQYRELAVNPAWATSSVRTWLLLAESGGSVVILFAMMYLERGRRRKRNLERLEWGG